MKRLLTLSLLLLSALAFGATTTPIQLLSPTGSTSGQVITSTGPATAPAWTTVTLSGLGGLAKANNLSDLVSASAARTNLGLGTAATQPSTAFAQVANNLSDLASVTTARSNLGLGTAATVNTGTSGATIPLLNGANTWAAAQTFSVRPTFNSATPWDSANLNFATPPAIGGTTPAAGAFTTLSATGAITPSQTAGIIGTNASNDANVGSVGEYQAASTTGTSLTSGTANNCASVSLSAGDWDVRGVVKFTPAGSTIPAGVIVGINTTSATLGTDDTNQGFNATFATGTIIRMSTPVVRIRIGSTTTVYLVGYSIFSTSTETCDGYIRARRVR